MKNRLKKELKAFFVILLIGGAYAFLVIRFGVMIPCLFNKATGLLCSACGVTRMIREALCGNFYIAYSYNKALFILFPFIALILIRQEARFIKSGKRELFAWEKVLLWLLIVLLVLFGIVRNII